MARARVGWIGLGIMGRPMASNLRGAGFEVTAYNRSAARLEGWSAAGGRRAASPREAAESADVLVTMVSDTADVESVLFGESGAAGALRPGIITVDMSTISPSATRGIARRLRERGIEHLDAPVSGGESGAIAATLSIMVGGEVGAFERCRDLFGALGKRVTYMGPSGAGQATKLVNQVAVLGNLAATCEALRLGRASGLDLARVVDAVGGGAGASWQLTNLGPKMIVGRLRTGLSGAAGAKGPAVDPRGCSRASLAATRRRARRPAVLGTCGVGRGRGRDAGPHPCPRKLLAKTPVATYLGECYKTVTVPSEGGRSRSWGVVGDVVTAWVLTFPVCGAIARVLARVGVKAA